MAKTAPVSFDNYVQSADITLEDVRNAAASGNGGVKPGIARQVRDPATGKLIKVELTFNDSASQNAVDAINANPGVPVASYYVPEQLMARGLDPANGLTIANWDPINAVIVLSRPNVSPAPYPAWGQSTYNINTSTWSYVNVGAALDNPVRLGIQFQNYSNLNIIPAAATFTFLTLDGRTIVAQFLQDRIPSEVSSCLVGINGAIYPCYNGIYPAEVPDAIWEDSVAQGQL